MQRWLVGKQRVSLGCAAPPTSPPVPVRVARPHPCCPPRCTLPRCTHALCCSHTGPGRVLRCTHAPAPRARTGRPHPPAPVRTTSAPRQTAPAHPRQRGRRKAPMALAIAISMYFSEHENPLLGRV